MKILHLVHRYWPYYGGSEKYFQEISERFAKDGHDVTVYTTDAWDLEYFWIKKDMKKIEKYDEIHNLVNINRYKVFHFPMQRYILWFLSYIPSWKLKCLFSTPLLPSLLRESLSPKNSFDIVHATALPYNSILYFAYKIAKAHSVPLIITPFVHIGEPENDEIRKYYTKKHQLELLKRADRIIVQTNKEKNALKKLGISENKQELLGMGVNLIELEGGKGDNFRNRLNIEKDEKIVCHLTTKAFDKGSIHLIKAMEHVWNQGLKAKLVLAGPSISQFDYYYNLLPKKIKQNCINIEFITGQEKKDLLDAMDIMVLPSRTDAFGIVFLEAWVYQKPVIGANAGGIPEIIDNTVNGFIIKFGDIKTLANKIIYLLKSENNSKKLGSKGKEKVLKYCTWDQRYLKIKEIYENLILNNG